MMHRQFATSATARMPDRESASRPDFGALATAVLVVTAPMKGAYSSSHAVRKGHANSGKSGDRQKRGRPTKARA
jgi:hypothetical protein